MLKQLRFRMFSGILAVTVVWGFSPPEEREGLDTMTSNLLSSMGELCELYCFDCVAENEIKTMSDPELEPGGYDFANPPTSCEVGNCAHGECNPEFALRETQLHERDRALMAVLDRLETAEEGVVRRLATRHPDAISLHADRRAIQVLGCNGVVAYVVRPDLSPTMFTQ